MRSVAYLALMVTPALASEVFPPSGIRAVLQETIYEPVGVPASSAKIMRLRFVAEEISDQETFDFAKLEHDFEWLCMEKGLPARTKAAPMVDHIIVSIASEAVTFGETAPSIVQYFDAFYVENEACIWEGL
jgi:hypothetical protein